MSDRRTSTPGKTGRSSPLLKAKISKLLDRAEDPAETLDYVYERQLGALQSLTAKLAEDRGPIFEQSRFSTPIELDAAVREMNAVEHRFVFFENTATGRGSVIYGRYDGHYGLIEPA